MTTSWWRNHSALAADSRVWHLPPDPTTTPSGYEAWLIGGFSWTAGDLVAYNAQVARRRFVAAGGVLPTCDVGPRYVAVDDADGRTRAAGVEHALGCWVQTPTLERMLDELDELVLPALPADWATARA